MIEFKTMTEDELVGVLQQASAAYYNGGDSPMTDDEFDEGMQTLRLLYPSNPFLDQVGAAPSSKRRKVKHELPMGSLNKVKEVSELEAWAGNRKLVVTPKVDGLALSIHYKGGKLVSAVTRGDGHVGQDVTDSVWEIDSVPKMVPLTVGHIEVRGEVYQPIAAFQKLRAEGDIGKNPRNIAAGALVGHDVSEVRRKGLEFIAYGYIKDGIPIAGKSDARDFIELVNLGFKTVNADLIHVDDFSSLCSQYLLKRDSMPYQMDGLVVAYDNHDDQAAAGYSGLNPRFRVAWKFQPEEKAATVSNIGWQVGRTGVVTPVIELLWPVDLGGSSVSFVTGHNWAFIRDKGVWTGAEIVVEKAGDVIPHVARVTKSVTAFPADSCPSCGAGLDCDDVRLICKNIQCPAQHERAVLHWLTTVGVLGVGPKMVSLLCESGLVKGLADLYYLDANSMIRLGAGDKVAANTVKAIMEKCEIPLAVFLDGLGVDGLGTSTSKLIAEKYQTLDAVRQLTVAELMFMDGIGSKTALAIEGGMKLISSRIDDLAKCVDVIPFKRAAAGPLTGLTFCITGTLAAISRAEVERRLADSGAVLFTNVRSGLNYLVQSDPTSESKKTVSAKKLGVKIIGETEMWEMMGK